MQESKQEQVKPLVVPSFRVWLCGALRVERFVNGSYEPIRTVEWGGSSYPRLLLKALLCCPGRQARREALMELLWPDAELEQAAQYLNTATTKLRAVLRPAKGRASLLMTENDSTLYRLEGQPSLWVDSDEALLLLKEAERLDHSAPEALRLLEEAAAYFSKGTFLQEEEGLWASSRRATVECAGYQCRTLLAETYIRHGMPVQAGTVLSMLLEEDPTDQDVLCRLMELLHWQGMTHRALSTYEEFARALKKTDQEPAESTTELYQRLKHAPRVPEMPPTLVTAELPGPQAVPELLPTAMSEIESSAASLGNRVTAQQGGPVFLLPGRSPGIVWPSHHQHQALNLLYATPDALPDAQHLGTWLALGASDLALLFEVGWTAEEVLDALHLPLQMIEDMPLLVRQQFRHLSNTVPMRGMPLPDSASLSSEEQAQLCISLGQNIAQSWKLFHTSKPSLTFAIAQAQLALVQRIHALLAPAVRPFFYAALYQLMGAALYLLGRFEQARHALEQSYLAGLEAANAWHMAQSLSWQAYLWKGYGKPSQALDVVDQALRLLSSQGEREHVRLRARLLALSAECMALLGDVSGAYERLHASETFLSLLLEPHEEFDRIGWLQQAGICALHLHDYPLAIQQLQLALDQLPPQWILRSIATAIPLAKALTAAREVGRTIKVIQRTMPLICSVQASVFTQQFVAYLEQDVLKHFPDDERCYRLAINARQQLVNQRRGY